MLTTTLKATVSGSFHEGMPAVQEAVYKLIDLGVDVLSPADPRVVDEFGDFLFVASDRLRSIRLIQQRHLAAIAASDFLWLVSPNGYVGSSASMEIGYAIAIGTPVFSSTVPSDLTLRQFVEIVPTIKDVLIRLVPPSGHPPESVLIDPAAFIARAHQSLEVVERELMKSRAPGDDRSARDALKTTRDSLIVS